jgi:NAD(P)-dependent dehydrogenase (short-subunit alcohol dehydrogenase family)
VGPDPGPASAASAGAGRDYLRALYSLEGRVAVVTGGTGVLGGAMAAALASAGARVAVLGRRAEAAGAAARGLGRAGAEALGLSADVRDQRSLAAARDRIVERWGAVHLLVNAAGGNIPAATLPEDADLFALSAEAFAEVVRLNLHGTLLPVLAFGRSIAEAGGGAVVNVSSMAAARALTRVGGYGAAKAAVENLTRWLAVEAGRRYGSAVRVNAIAPGFFLGEQNRALLTDAEGRPTARGRTIIAHTPAGRFGRPEELAGTLVWLCSPGAGFVTGAVIPVDGGFSAFAGV